MFRKAFIRGTMVAALSLIVASAPTAAASVPQAVPQAAPTSQQPPVLLDGGCGAAADSPHYSSGAKGVIFKTRYLCDVGFSMTVTEALSWLYFCGESRPSGGTESTWTGTYGCVPVRTSHYTANFNVGSGGTATRYTPEPGTEGAKNRGWYVGCTRYNRTGVSGTIRVWSPIVYVEG
jgi:hypothetical protein